MGCQQLIPITSIQPTAELVSFMVLCIPSSFVLQQLERFCSVRLAASWANERRSACACLCTIGRLMSRLYHSLMVVMERLRQAFMCAQTFGGLLGLRLPGGSLERLLQELLQPQEVTAARRELRGESSSCTAALHACLLQHVRLHGRKLVLLFWILHAGSARKAKCGCQCQGLMSGCKTVHP